MENLITIKFMVCCSMLTGLGIPAAQGQALPFTQKCGSEEDFRKLFYLNTVYIQSWIRADTATFNRLLWAEDFVQQSSNGRLVPKLELSPVFGQARMESIDYFYADNVTIQFITNDAAMVYATTPYRSKGETATSWSRYNDVYVRRNGNWVCVSANISPVVEQGDPVYTFTKVAPTPSLISYHTGTDADIKALQELNARQAEALARAEPDLLEDILADDFTLLQSNGLLCKKQEILEQLRKQAADHHLSDYNIEQVSIRFVAPDVAMIHAAMVITFKDGKVKGTQYNDIYVKRNERWVCVAGNNSPIH